MTAASRRRLRDALCFSLMVLRNSIEVTAPVSIHHFGLTSIKKAADPMFRIARATLWR